MELQLTKKCGKCGNEYPLTEEFFYPARKKDRAKVGWQSNCRPCWKAVNQANKARRKAERILSE